MTQSILLPRTEWPPGTVSSKFNAREFPKWLLTFYSRAFFEDGDYIFVPELQEDDPYDAAWVGLEHCLWDAPPNMISKYSLKYVFEQIVEEGQLEHLLRFFRHTLGIPNASWSDLTGELVERSQNHCVDFDQIFDMYKYIFEMEVFLFTDDLRQVSTSFFS